MPQITQQNAISSFLSFPSPSPLDPHPLCALPADTLITPRYPLPSLPSRLRSNYPDISSWNREIFSSIQQTVVIVPDPRAWVGDFGAANGDSDHDDDDEEDEGRSLDLLVRLLQNLFQKVSRHARKAVRSVLPPSISSKLVRFTVNGVLILAFLWLLKAFIEVACTIGSAVFLSILIVRGIWSGMSYFKENQSNYMNTINNDNNSSWNGVQPVA